MRRKRYKVVIFDWDGTLADSTARIIDSMKAAACDVGMASVPDEAIRHIIGLSLPKALQVIWPSISPCELQAMEEGYVRNFSAEGGVRVSFFAGLKPLLEVLQLKGCKLAVATGKSRRGLDEMLEAMRLGGHSLHQVFDATRCADETRSKPDPAMLHELLDELALKPEDALMVGDTSFDLDMARAISMDSVGLTHGAHGAEVLAASNPRALCQSLTELQQWMQLNG